MELLSQPLRTLFGVGEDRDILVLPAPNLALEPAREQVLQAISTGRRVFVLFDSKMGGEVSLPGSDASPEMSFDVTCVELIAGDAVLDTGRFAILEIQTMDFHGSYGGAVRKLRNALDLHRDEFPRQIERNPGWAGEGIEGPNISNVFKRTFYQMMFKFGFADLEECAGVALILPQAVWDSWQPFLAKPSLTERPGGLALDDGSGQLATTGRTWIYVFDFVAESRVSPTPLAISSRIDVDPRVMARLAFESAPHNASQMLASDKGVQRTLRRRLHNLWSEGFRRLP
jgi:hypothetical protein